MPYEFDEIASETVDKLIDKPNKQPFLKFLI